MQHGWLRKVCMCSVFVCVCMCSVFVWCTMHHMLHAVYTQSLPCCVHKIFLSLTHKGNPSVRTLFESLREVSVYERAIPYHMWLLVFPIVWQTLPKEQQVTLAKPLISLLSREYHARQAMQRPNVVQVCCLWCCVWWCCVVCGGVGVRIAWVGGCTGSIRHHHGDVVMCCGDVGW